MPRLGTLRGPAAPLAALAALAAPAAHADLSAEAVWQAWQAYSADAGLAAEATLSRDGDTLTARDVRFTGGAEDARLRSAIDRIDFVEQPDGTVAVTMTEAYRIEVTGADGTRAVVAVRHPGLRIVVSESATGLSHAVTASEIAVVLEALEGPETPAVETMQAIALGVGGVYDIPRETGGPYAVDLTLASLTAEIAAADGADGIDLSYAASGLKLTADVRGLDPAGAVAPDELPRALARGFAVELGVAYDMLRYSLEATDDGRRSAAAGRAVEGTSRFALSGKELSFRTASRNPEITLEGPDLPVPELSVAAAQLAYGVRVPTIGAADPQEVGVHLRLMDVSVPESLWAMVDPMARLARGPATLVLDLLGAVVLPADLFGMETMLAYMVGGPLEAAQPTAMEIRELKLRAAGAELTGSGSFTFDPDDRETFGGLPRPEGALDLALSGGNALLDGLAEIGLLPEDQAMAARMVLALFARPGPGQDQLVSRLEVREDGSVFANGMRLQ